MEPRPQPMLAAAERLIKAAVEDRRLPGAALGAVGLDGTHAVCAHGHAQWEPDEIELAPDMWFDLASLTKVIVTVPEILRLTEAGEADLEDQVGRFLPEAAPQVARLTLRQLLCHQAGFEPYTAFQDWSKDPASLRDLLVRHPWSLGPPVYSDIGYILLGLVLERVHSRRLDEFPMPQGLSFRPDPAACVATEDCPWRGNVLRGAVHDERAHSLGGAAGHAGLFGTVSGVLDFARAMLSCEALSPAALAEMRRPNGDEWALGWQHKYTGWSGGSLCSEETLGHTGFTGTGLWIDFGRGYAWTLLTNRVHPSRERETGIAELRRHVGGAVAAAWRPANGS